MKTVSKKEYKLNYASVDRVSEDLQIFMDQLGTPKKEKILSRLSVEEILLGFVERFGEDVSFTYTKNNFLGKPYITICVQGDPFNPLEKDDADEFGDFSSSFIEGCDYAPSYSYFKGVNSVTVKFKKKTVNPTLQTAIAIVAAIMFSLLRFVLPESSVSFLTQEVLTPLYNAFIGIMATIELPLVFFSVVCGIIGIGDSTVFGKIGRKMVIKFSSLVFIATSAAAIILSLVLHIMNYSSDSNVFDFKGGLQMILDIVPKNLAEPFSSSNAMQIMLIALIIGLSLITLGNKAKGLVALTNESNRLIVNITKNICRLMPIFVFVTLLNLIWTSYNSMLYSMWKPILAFVVILIIFYLCALLFVGKKEHVNVFILSKKMLNTFFIALGTASSTAVNGECSEVLHRKMGVSKRFVDFGQPIGSVIFMPSTSIGFLICSIFMARYYNMQISLVWLFISVIICSFVAISTPPIPGGAIAAYSLIFTQLNIPLDAVAIMISLDFIFDFIATAFDVVFLQLELVSQADSNKMLDRTVLEKDTKAL